MIKEGLAELWRRYSDVWDWLVDKEQAKVGGYILAFVSFATIGLIIGHFISELMR